MHTKFHRFLVLSFSVRVITVSVRRTRFNVLVLLTLPLTGESPTCTLHEGVSRAIEVSHAACKADFFQESFLVGLTAEWSVFYNILMNTKLVCVHISSLHVVPIWIYLRCVCRDSHMPYSSRGRRVLATFAVEHPALVQFMGTLLRGVLKFWFKGTPFT